MSLKSLICLFGGYDYEVDALHTAIILAKQHAAHLRLVHPQAPYQPYVGMYGGGTLMGGEFYETIERQNNERMGEAREVAAKACREHDIGFDIPVSLDKGALATFQPLSYRSHGELARAISLCDLIVSGHPMGSSVVSQDTALGTALFSTVRPVLLVSQRTTVSDDPVWSGKTALIAWRDTPEAVRAVLHAMPLLESAQKVHIATAYDSGSPSQADSQSLAIEYLSAHGIALEQDAIDRADRPAAEVIGTHARDIGADFIVMGAYGHSAFRQMLLGGFSASMLEDCPLPMILSH